MRCSPYVCSCAVCTEWAIMAPAQLLTAPARMLQLNSSDCHHDRIDGLAGVRGQDYVCFYDWDEGRLVRRIDVAGVRDVLWSDGGELVAIAGEASFYLLQVRGQDKDRRRETSQRMGGGRKRAGRVNQSSHGLAMIACRGV